MTEKKSADSDSNESSYLVETFVTKDGVEVPPPTRPMGPRRLARYRDDAAAYLRALRDGDELPEEPVAYMPLPDTGYSPNPDTVEKTQRLQALAQRGGIDTSTETSMDVFESGGKDTRDDVAISEGSVQGLSEDSDQTELLVADQVVSASDFTITGDVVFDDEETDRESEAGSGLEATEESFDDESASGSLSLPEPVRALEARGLDLTDNDLAVEDDFDSDSSGSEEWDHEDRDVLRPKDDEDAGSEKKSNRRIWLMLLVLVILIALVAVWSIFLQ